LPVRFGHTCLDRIAKPFPFVFSTQRLCQGPRSPPTEVVHRAVHTCGKPSVQLPDMLSSSEVHPVMRSWRGNSDASVVSERRVLAGRQAPSRPRESPLWKTRAHCFHNRNPRSCGDFPTYGARRSTAQTDRAPILLSFATCAVSSRPVMSKGGRPPLYPPDTVGCVVCRAGIQVLGRLRL
jgi:hypothetical protein